MALQARQIAPVRGMCNGRGAVRGATVVVRAAPEAKATQWHVQYQFLVDKGLRSIPSEEASALVSKGKCVIVDVRPKDAYDKAHVAGAVSVPLYQAIDWSSGQIAAKALKFIAYSFNGVSPIEPNPNFMEQISKVTDNGSKAAITLCEAGGTMKPSVNFPQGKASRSLQSAFRIMSETGAVNVMHLERGQYGWYQAGLPFEGTEEYKPDVGRTPMAAFEPTLKQMASARGYEMRPDDKQ